METTTQDWKADIGQLFAEKKIYRLEFLNKHLWETIKEWADYLKKFDYITVGTDKGDPAYGFPYEGSTIILKHREYFPFIIMAGYTTNSDSSEIILKLKFSKSLKMRELFNKGLDDDKKNHVFSEEQYTGDHIYDNEFVFWVFNSLLKKWLDSKE